MRVVLLVSLLLATAPGCLRSGVGGKVGANAPMADAGPIDSGSPAQLADLAEPDAGLPDATFTADDAGPAGPGQAGDCCDDFGATCAAGLVCVFPLWPDHWDNDGLVDMTGVCAPPPPVGSCYRDDDCEGSGNVCAGAPSVSCGADTLPSLGTCVWSGFGACCYVDSDCASGLVCAFSGSYDPSPPEPGEAPSPSGMCGPPPDEGQCFHATDCADGEVCVGADVSHCWQSAFDYQPGSCQPAASATCCWGQSDCSPGQVCVDETCLPAPTPDGCWAHIDCHCGWADCDAEPTTYCAGVDFCSCSDGDEPCPMPDIQGSCAPLPTPGTPCASWVDCGPLLGCVDLDCDGDSGWVGACLGLLPIGSCWTDAQCGFGQACLGEQLAACGVFPTGDEPVAGTCQPSSCCLVGDNCPAGQRCVPVDSLGVCKSEAVADGACWDDQDCPDDSVCHGAWICPCDVDCDDADKLGSCVPLPNGG